MQNETLKVLVVDDSLYMRSLIVEHIKGAGHEVIGQASTGEEAVDMAIEMQPDVITLDVILPDMIGLDVIKFVKQEKVTSKIVMISVVGQQPVINSGLKLGANAYLIKPFTKETLVSTIESVMH